MDINDLPDELLLHIFSFVSINTLTDLLKLTLICKNWRRLLWSKDFLEYIGSFEYQSRFLIYHCKPNSLNQFIEYDQNSSTSFLTINGSLSSLKQNIENCSLTNMTISMWCRSLEHLSLQESTILLLWHFHLGYIGFYRDVPAKDTALIKCTYTQEHQLKTEFHMEYNQWYHIAILIKEENDLLLYINGNKIGNWLLEKNINKENVSITRHSSVWFASHCGANHWHGSLFDICIWKRCLEPYEIKEIARTRITIDKINFISSLKLL